VDQLHSSSAGVGGAVLRQIVDQVAQLIRSGGLSPGTQLPSVRELASQLLVSLITVRRRTATSRWPTSSCCGRFGTFVAEEIATATRAQRWRRRGGARRGDRHARRLGSTCSRSGDVAELLAAEEAAMASAEAVGAGRSGGRKRMSTRHAPAWRRAGPGRPAGTRTRGAQVIFDELLRQEGEVDDKHNSDSRLTTQRPRGEFTSSAVVAGRGRPGGRRRRTQRCGQDDLPRSLAGCVR